MLVEIKDIFQVAHRLNMETFKIFIDIRHTTYLIIYSIKYYKHINYNIQNVRFNIILYYNATEKLKIKHKKYFLNMYFFN